MHNYINFDKVSTMIEIDGSYREGGGQILRTALSLSCLFQKPFRISNIRKDRKKPGLMPQHLTCVRAAQLLSNAEVAGDYIGSTELLFSPREMQTGEFYFDIGTAGSTSLVLQTLIPAIVFSNVSGNQKTTITLKGGTHVPFSPSFHYLDNIFASFLRKLGIEINLSIESYGFYPQGGGKVRAEIVPVKNIKPLNITERGALLKLRGYSGVGNLPFSIAERQRNTLLEEIFSSIAALTPTFEEVGEGSFENFPVDIDLLNVSTPGQGTFIFVQSESEHSTAGFTSLGERRKMAEIVGEEAAKEFLAYYETGAAIDPHLADQIVLYLSMCNERSVFTTSCITEHLMTNLWAIGLFHAYKYSVEGEPGKPWIVRINKSPL
jgi:RNA 3'-terminal phosphate cyclase (ATP)